MCVPSSLSDYLGKFKLLRNLLSHLCILSDADVALDHTMAEKLPYCFPVDDPSHENVQYDTYYLNVVKTIEAPILVQRLHNGNSSPYDLLGVFSSIFSLKRTYIERRGL